MEPVRNTPDIRNDVHAPIKKTPKYSQNVQVVSIKGQASLMAIKQDDLNSPSNYMEVHLCHMTPI